jgi:glycosyltransferase involved in cell wall biosynthesis
VPAAISIVTPSLNQGCFIEEAIGSVINQRYEPFEHIVVDGGSSDETIAVLKRHPHLKWVSERDGGQGNAVNKGIGMTTGEIVGWLNADDYYCPDAFRVVAKAFDDPGVMVVCGDGFVVDSGGHRQMRLTSLHSRPEDLIPFWWWKYQFVHPSFFIRKKALEVVGSVDERLEYAMDVDLLIRLGLRFPFRYIAEPLAAMRMHPGSKTGRSMVSVVPPHVREMLKVSRRYWGRTLSLRHLGYTCSFLGGLGLSLVRNIFLVPGSKLRTKLSHK